MNMSFDAWVERERFTAEANPMVKAAGSATRAAGKCKVVHSQPGDPDR